MLLLQSLLALALFPQTASGSALAALPQERVDRVEGWTRDLDFWLAAAAREHYVWRGKELPEALLARADWLHEHTRPGTDLVVLMGRNTFSAAQIFLARVSSET